MYLFDGRIRYSEVDNNGKLTFPALVNYFQDCSTFQSEDLGVGIKYLSENHLVWVLSAWQIVVERMPGIGERVQTGTQPYEFRNFMGMRNFAMIAEDGSFLAKANSVWSLLNTENWKPALPPEEMKRAYQVCEKLDMEYAPRKIAIPEGGSNRESIVIKKHHLDTNNHVNNGQYVDMAMEYLPADFEIRQMRAEYKMQTLLDDVLIPYVAEREGCVTVVLSDEAGKVHTIVEFTGEMKR